MADWRTFGTATYNWPEDFAISDLSPDAVSRAGGDLVTVVGTFKINQAYQCRVDGVVCYGGTAGKGNVVMAEDVTSLTFVTPQLGKDRVGVRLVEVQEMPGGPIQTGNLTILERSFGSFPLGMRRMFPPWYGVGPRRIELEQPET